MKNTRKVFMAVFMVLAMLAVAVVPLTESQSDGAVGTGGSLYGMGENQYGQQGAGTATNVTTTTQIGATLGTITDVVCSGSTTFFLTSDGKLYGMGANTNGQQGDGTTTKVTTPTQIGATLGTITDVVCSENTTFFLTSDGKLYGMGLNNYGQQGAGTATNVTTSTQIGATLGTITDVVCSENTTFFLTSDGKLYGMGKNDFSQQGDGTTTNVKTPTQIGATLGTITDVVCSTLTTFFLTSDGKLYGMGLNSNGQQGAGTATKITTPTQIGATLGTITDVVCSGSTTFFLTSDGKLYGMGLNGYGQQGDGTTTNVTTPTQIGATLGTITDVACSQSTTFFLTSDGKLYGMGMNSNGQQGDGTTTDVTTPTQIGATIGTITNVICSDVTTFFLTSDGKLYGIGYNGNGQQGDGTTTDVKTPTQIGSTLGTITDVVCSGSTTFFLALPPEPTVTISVNEPTYGTVSTNSVTAPSGTSISANNNVLTIGSDTVTATSSTDTAEWDYRFVEWTGIPVGGTVTADVTITAVFEAVKRNYDVTITASPTGYGTVSDNQITVPYGTSISASNNVLTVGTDTVTATPSTATAQYTYAFGSWAGIPVGGTITGDTDITATFTGTVNNYTVTVQSNDSSYGTVSPASVANVPYGTVITASDNTISVNGTTVIATPATDTAEWDYSFVNWSVGGSPIASSYTTNGDVTIQANFERSAYEYTVSFAVNDANYGSVSPTSVADVPSGTTFSVNGNKISVNGTEITATEIDSVQYDSSFVGWYDAQTGGNQITSSTAVQGDMTVYARFSATVKDYTVTVNSNNTSYGTVSPTSIANVPYGTAITVSDNTVTVNGTTVTATAKPGDEELTYNFIRWQMNGVDISGQAYTDDHTVLTAVFGAVAETYTITWIIDGTEEQTTVEAGAMPTHAEPTKQYYTFNGWQPKVVKATKDATYTATFKPITYTVTWDPNGGHVSPSTSKGSVETAVTVPTPTMEFYSFDGWFTEAQGGTQIVTPYMPTADVTFYAHWSIQTYTVSFDAQGGSAVSPMEGTQFTPVSLPNATGTGNFAGWYTQPTGGKLIGFNNTLYYPKADITMYAQWSDEAVFTYSLNFDVNGGYNAPSAQVAKGDDNVEHVFKINGSSPKKADMSFIGWATTSSATEPEYKAWESITVQANSTVTLYAVWSDSEEEDVLDAIIDMIPLVMIIGVILAITAVFFKGRAEGLEVKELTKMMIGVSVIIIVICLITIPILNSL